MPPRPSLTVYTNNNTIERGESTTIFWESFNADAVNISHIGDVALSGSKRVSPTSTITYSGVAYSIMGSARDSVTITVTEPPAPPPEPPPPEPPPPEPPKPPIPPPPGECPDFWEDPVGWVLCTITNGFSVFAEWFGTSFWSFVADMGVWLAKFSIEFQIFLQDPLKYINDAIRTFILGREQKTATDFMDLRKNEEDHWQTGTDWIAGQYKTVDDLTADEFQLLIDKGLTDDKEALRAADFRVYKLDASSKAALETTMRTLRSEIGGLWFGIDTKTSELLDVFNVGHTYLVNYVETIESNLPDTIGDIIQGIGSFVNGGFLDFDTWQLQFGLDVAGYTDSKILDVKEWFNISLPELIEPMFEWAKPVIQPIMDAVGFLGQIVGIVTGTAPESESVKSVKENYKTQTDRINEILED